MRTGISITITRSVRGRLDAFGGIAMLIVPTCPTTAQYACDIALYASPQHRPIRALSPLAANPCIP